MAVDLHVDVTMGELDALVDYQAKRAGTGIYLLAEAAMTLARQWTPVDTGNLRASGRVEHPVIRGDHIEVTMGNDTNYAFSRYLLPQSRAHSGRERWLEQAVLTIADTAESRMAAFLSNGF